MMERTIDAEDEEKRHTWPSDKMIKNGKDKDTRIKKDTKEYKNKEECKTRHTNYTD